MEQLRQLGEVAGGIKALMAFEPDLRINPRQCRLLADTCAHALDAVTAHVRAHLRFDERAGTKWRALDSPLRELHRALRDAEGYIRHCLDPRASWWARAAAMAHGTDCVEHHLHNILWCVSVAIDAVETAGEIAGSEADDDARARTRLVLAKKYDRDMLEPKLFQLALGDRYLVSRELVARMDAAWKEDRWALSQLFDGMEGSAAPKRLTRNEQRLAEVLAAPRGRLHPASILIGGDYSVRRRLGGRLKEVQWMGESFAMKHFIGDGGADAEIELLASVSHPNVAHAAYCFHDEERKEYFVIMDQLMAKDLGSYVKEVSCPRRRTLLPPAVAVDIMLQIARGMKYLHAKGIYHGQLNPSNVLVKPRNSDVQVQVKVTGFGKSGGGIPMGANVDGGDNACIWYAPEVLKPEGAGCSEKADVYSFAMICFELLTGKVPLEDNHLQGDKTSKNIRAGERPLFPFQTPKYLTSLTKRCWHAEPEQRPGFSSVCRVLRYMKRFLVMNPEQQQQQQQQQADADAPIVPPVDYLDVEMQLLKRLPAWQRGEGARVSDVPFQMFAYKVLEREKTKDKASDSGSDGSSLYGDENGVGVGAMSPDHPSSASNGGTTRPLLDSSEAKKLPSSAKKADGKAPRQPGPPHKVKPANPARTPQAPRRTLGVKTDGIS